EGACRKRPCVLLFFYIQAEDGIRDFHVTGVQTCALPISMPTFRKQYDKLRLSRERAQVGAKRSTVEHGRDVDALLAAEEAQQRRSEERRVGKEYRKRERATFWQKKMVKNRGIGGVKDRKG